MGYRFVDHTAEVQLELEAPTREGVFVEAVLALGDLLGGDGTGEDARSTREVTAEAPDGPALLAAWLDELVFLAENEGLVPVRADGVEAGPTAVRGTVAFAAGVPPHLVKGVTYHDLLLDRVGETWRGRVVLDV